MPIAVLKGPPAEGLRTQRASRTEALQLEISVVEAWPWPGMTIRAAARYLSALIRLRKLKLQGDRMFLHDAELIPDPADALLVRTLLGLPTVDGVAYRASGSLFAPVLALLRLSSENVVRRESELLANCVVLSQPPEPVLVLEGSWTEGELSLQALGSYRAAEGTPDLGLPVDRGPAWWAFPKAVAPAPAPLSDPRLQRLFEPGASAHAGPSAWEVLDAVRAAASELNLRTSDEIAALLRAQPLRPALRLEHAAGHGLQTPGTPEAVQATLCFEAQRDGPAAGATFSTAELAAATGRGERCVRRGKAWYRVDPQDLREAQAALAQVAGSGITSGVTPGSTCAEGEGIPELLVWAQSRQRDPESPWNVYVSQAVGGAHQVDAGSAELRLRLGVDEGGPDSWFTLSAHLEAGGHVLTAREIERLLKQRKKWLRLGTRWIRLDTAKYAAGQEQARRYGFKPTGPLATSFRADTRERVEALFSLAGSAEHSAQYRAFLERLEGFSGLQAAPVPDGWRLPLRTYQAQGLSWLLFLTRYGLNGILADDMGLGKTAQTLALLSSMREARGSSPSLIVCPTSLVQNWRAEVLKFDPRLRVLHYGGAPARRDRLRPQICAQDLVLATYATVRNDASLLKDEQWRCLILDEAHVIKNAAAAITKAIKTIPARHRLALTGTPVQNRLDELWSLFDFLMPGFLGTHAGFFHRYEEPIAKGRAGDASREEGRRGELATELLRKRIAPFILRRLKTEVARELPEKIVQDRCCMLVPDQAALYREFTKSEEAHRAVRELEEHGPARAQTQIFAALMALRKICNHPDLVYLSKEVSAGKRIVPLPGYEERSGKLQALADLLEACREGGHRALIFSQFTSMLDILEHFLRARGSACLRLDGSTPPGERQGLVDRFNRDPEIPVFLISTRAGGSGLNLTGADTVIFYDHDWNPANDRQAMDRAHRIGQTRVVNVYRLVAQGTFEEKILERQELKLALAGSVVTQEEGVFKNITREELLELFTLSEER